MEINLRAFKNLTLRDLRALGVFLGIALLCTFYFLSGIMVTYVPSSTSAVSPVREGYTVWVLGFKTYESAELLSSALVIERRIQAMVEPVPYNGYLVKIGPFIQLETAVMLTSELQDSGYDLVKILENCPPGNNCTPKQPGSGSTLGKQYQ
ncbi:MAG: hypothetical protein L0220_24315 [Acidobacteria bacterium]|nr:hypothetical protein [Acidobacteriota bacterium]